MAYNVFDFSHFWSNLKTLLNNKVDKVSGMGLSQNSFTNEDKTKLDGIDAEATKTVVDASLNSTSTNPVQNKAVALALDSKADATAIPIVPITAIQKNSTDITPVSGTVNITVPTTAADISALPDTTKYAAALSITINSSTFVVTCQLKDQNGDNLGTAQTIDLPLESVVVGGDYNSQTKKVVLTLQNGNTIEFSVADLVSGLQTELSESNKLNSAYINYDSTHRAVSDTEKSTWNNKQDSLTTAQLAAVNSGITAERLETIDASLSDKVDKETGKGLSTNDYTNADKANLATALTMANAAAPQATTYSKTEVDTALAAKLNTADVDDALSETSTNPVQNRIVKNAIGSKQDTLNAAQLAAVNSGITSEEVSQIKTNKTNIASLAMRKVYTAVHNTSTTHSYTMKVSDFNNSQAGTYLITIVTWSAVPSFSLYAASYSGNNVTTVTNLTKIAGADANINITDGVISCTTTGKIQIIAVQ